MKPAAFALAVAGLVLAYEAAVLAARHRFTPPRCADCGRPTVERMCPDCDPCGVIR